MNYHSKRRPTSINPNAIVERTDLYLMQPRNTSLENMRSRLGVVQTLNLQDGPTLVVPGKFQPQKGAVLVYHLNRMTDYEMIRQQILVLARTAAHQHHNVVVSSLRGTGDQLRRTVEALPHTNYIQGDGPGQDVDLILLKMIRRWKELAAYAESAYRPSEGPFSEVTDPQEQRKLLRDAVDSHAAIVVSPYSSSYELQGRFVGYDDERGIIRCQIEGRADEIAQCMSEADASKRLALSLSLKQSRVFFATTDFQWTKDAVLEIKVPSLLSFVQRRKSFRYVLYADGRHTLTLNNGAGSIFSDIYDVSVGGVSIICTARELQTLKDVEDKLSGQFVVDGQTVIVDRLLLRHARKFGNRQGKELFHLGFSFEKMANGYDSTLAMFVNSRAARYFQDYLNQR